MDVPELLVVVLGIAAGVGGILALIGWQRESLKSEELDRETARYEELKAVSLSLGERCRFLTRIYERMRGSRIDW